MGRARRRRPPGPAGRRRDPRDEPDHRPRRLRRRRGRHRGLQGGTHHGRRVRDLREHPRRAEPGLGDHLARDRRPLRRGDAHDDRLVRRGVRRHHRGQGRPVDLLGGARPRDPVDRVGHLRPPADRVRALRAARAGGGLGRRRLRRRAGGRPRRHRRPCRRRPAQRRAAPDQRRPAHVGGRPRTRWRSPTPTARGRSSGSGWTGRWSTPSRRARAATSSGPSSADRSPRRRPG